jgi:hypothetical protein
MGRFSDLATSDDVLADTLRGKGKRFADIATPETVTPAGTAMLQRQPDVVAYPVVNPDGSMASKTVTVYGKRKPAVEVQGYAYGPGRRETIQPEQMTSDEASLRAVFPGAGRASTAGLGQRAAQVVGDVASFPFRVGSGGLSAFSSAANDFTSSDAKTWGDLLQNAGSAYMNDMATPGGESRGSNPITSTLRSIATNPANASLFLPVIGEGRAASVAGRLAQMLPQIAASEALNQAGQYGNTGRFDPAQAGMNLAVGAGLGGAAEGATYGLGKLGASLRDRAPQMLLKAWKPEINYIEGIREAAPEMFARGAVRPTWQGLQQGIAEQKAALHPVYSAAFAQHPDANINLEKAVIDAAQGLQGDVSRGRVASTAFDSPVNDLFTNTQGLNLESGMATPELSVAFRNTIRSNARAFDASKAKSAAAEKGLAKAVGANLNAQMDELAPAVRAVDAYAAPVYAFKKGMPQIETRMKQHSLGLKDLLTAGLAGATGAHFLGPIGAIVGGASGIAQSIADRTPAASLLAYNAPTYARKLSDLLRASAILGTRANQGAEAP